MEDRIDFRPGPALESLRRLESGLEFDFAFIDAEKTEYEAYFELLLPRMRPNGLVLFDNMLWSGRVGRGEPQEAKGRAIDHLNRKLAKDRRVDTLLLAIADGVLMCRKR